MQFASTAVLVLVMTAAGCSTPEFGFEESVPGGLLVRVVDEAGEPVAGAEVRSEGAAGRPLQVLDYLLAGSLGRADEFGSKWRTDSRGEVRVPAGLRYRHVVARAGDRFGAAYVEEREPAELVVAIEREATVEARCVDTEGRPAPGSLMWVAVDEPAAEQTGPSGLVWWGARVNAADGTIQIPHAQLWRALQREGSKVSVAGFVWWGAEMGGESVAQFPATHDEPLVFTVSPHGFLDVHLPSTTVPADSEVWLRWLNPPLDPDDPDDVPEVSFGVREGWNPAVPLGARFEAVLHVEGVLDPRVQFDGPTRPGEHVAVALPEPRLPAVVSGRLVDERGAALPFHEFDIWVESPGARIDPDDGWRIADGTGKFTVEFAPGTSGVMHVALTGMTASSGATFSFTFRGSEERPTARVEIEHALETGITELGDIALGAVVRDREP